MVDTQIKLAVRDDLENWQKLNVTAFLMGGIGSLSNTVGEVYEDKSGVKYLPLIKQPIIVYKATKEELTSLLAKANERGFETAIYTEELFKTNNDIDNRAEVKKVETNQLNLVGIAIVGAKNPMSKMFKKIAMHD